MDNPCRVLVIVKFVFIKAVVILRLYLAFRLFPDRNHTVEGAKLGNVPVLGFLAFLALFFLYRLPCGELHFNRVADIVGILLDKSAYAVLVKILVIILVLGFLLYMERDRGADRFLFAGLYRVAFGTARFPAERLVRTERAALDRHMVAHHKRRVKTDAELTYYIHVFLFFVFLLKGK